MTYCLNYTFLTIVLVEKLDNIALLERGSSPVYWNPITSMLKGNSQYDVVFAFVTIGFHGSDSYGPHIFFDRAIVTI